MKKSTRRRVYLLHGAAVFVLAAGLSGCAKDASYKRASRAPSPQMADAGAAPGYAVEESYNDYDDDMGDAMGDGEYEPEAEFAEAPAEPAVPPEPAAHKAKDEGPTAMGEGGERTPEAGNQPDDQPKTFTRQIIYTADMTVSVFNLEDAMEKAEGIATKAGGYVQSMSAGQYVLRIPAASLREVMENLGGLGVVESRNLQARDVTEEFFDLQTRITVLERTHAQLLELLKKAKTVKDALAVREALDKVTMELEQAKGRLRLLSNLIGYSTLTVRIEERGPHTSYPSSDDPFPWVDSLGVEATEWK